MNVILPCLDDGELLGQILKIIYDHNMGILASRRDGGNWSGQDRDEHLAHDVTLFWSQRESYLDITIFILCSIFYQFFV